MILRVQLRFKDGSQIDFPMREFRSDEGSRFETRAGEFSAVDANGNRISAPWADLHAVLLLPQGEAGGPDYQGTLHLILQALETAPPPPEKARRFPWLGPYKDWYLGQRQQALERLRGLL